MENTTPVFDLSLEDIHYSVETALNDIKHKHKKIDSELQDINFLKRVISDVLTPLLRKSNLSEICSVEDLRTLKNICWQKKPSYTSDSLHNFGKFSECHNSTEISKLSPKPPLGLKPKFANVNRRRKIASKVPSSLNGNAPLRNGILPPLPPFQRKDDALPTLPFELGFRIFTPETHCNLHTAKNARTCPSLEAVPDIKRIELTNFTDKMDTAIQILRETFVQYTQTVLVPLQIFCKPDVFPKEKSEDDITHTKRGAKEKTKLRNCLDRSEMKIVQIMNEIRQLLWVEERATVLFTYNSRTLSKKITDGVEFENFPIIHLVSQSLEMFGEALQLASTWLKFDTIYVKNAEAALLRAHKKYVKTQELWQQSRNEQHSLLEKITSTNKKQHSESALLEKIKNDMKSISKVLSKATISKNELEEKMEENDNFGKLRVKHSMVKKNIIQLLSKIEDRERSYRHIESHVLSLKADQDALAEKLKISKNYVDNLRTKMEQLYEIRNTLNSRYEERTDHERLQMKWKNASLKAPLLQLREKQFTVPIVCTDDHMEPEERRKTPALCCTENSVFSVGKKQAIPLPRILSPAERLRHSTSAECEMEKKIFPVEAQNDFIVNPILISAI